MNDIERLPDEQVESLKGALIGEGTTRKVFSHAGNMGLIIKESKFIHDANIIEALIYSSIAPLEPPRTEQTDLYMLFGKVELLSMTGKFLVMERLSDITKQRSLAFISNARLPWFVNDRKPSAFGVDANDNVKCRDYGLVRLQRALDKDRPRG